MLHGRARIMLYRGEHSRASCNVRGALTLVAVVTLAAAIVTNGCGKSPKSSPPDAAIGDAASDASTLGSGGTSGAGAGDTGGVRSASSGSGGGLTSTGGSGGAFAGSGGATSTASAMDGGIDAGSGGSQGGAIVVGGSGGRGIDGGAGAATSYPCGRGSCVVGKSYCQSYIPGLGGSTGSQGCQDVPDACAATPTCACICPSPYDCRSSATCSCTETGGLIDVRCAGS